MCACILSIYLSKCIAPGRCIMCVYILSIPIYLHVLRLVYAATVCVRAPYDAHICEWTVVFSSFFGACACVSSATDPHSGILAWICDLYALFIFCCTTAGPNSGSCPGFSNVPFSYWVRAMGTFSLLTYWSEFWLRVTSFRFSETRQTNYLGV